MKNVILGCEESQILMTEMRRRGHNAYSCDLKPCSGGFPQYHLQMDVFKAIRGGYLETQAGDVIFIEKWDVGIFFPDCTYLTSSAEWAYKEPPYHQKLKVGTLFGQERRKARQKAIGFVIKLWNSKIESIGIENPIGKLSSIMKPSQIIHPYMFGDDASKSTCLWLKNLPLLSPTSYVEPRIVDGKKRWGNQTDSGQNRLSPSNDRAELRSKTYSGIAKAMAEQWG